MSKKIGLIAMLTLAPMAVACGGGGGGGSSTGGGGDTTSGGESQYAGPIDPAADAAHGETRFAAVCGGCHNNGNGPTVETMSSLAWTPERMRQQIREGSGGMPAIAEARLSAADMEAVLAYFASIGAVAAQ